MRTPPEILGPFYPVPKPMEQDADLTTLSGRSGRAQGQVIELIGQVLDTDGQPVPGARVEIWQANTFGRYAHASDRNPAPLDPYFQGFAAQIADSQGRFHFKTIKPGAYPATPNWMRPPHIHFEVTGRTDRLVTQMYFPGEPLNDKDLLLQSVRFNKEGTFAKFVPPTKEFAPDSVIALWNVVLSKG